MVLQDSVSVRLCQKHCVKALPCSLTHSHGVNNDDDDGGGDDDDDEKETIELMVCIQPAGSSLLDGLPPSLMIIGEIIILIIIFL